MRSKAKWPSSLDVCVRVVFVAGLTRLTVAPATTLPCGSVTVPRTEDVPVCADAVAQQSASRREQRSASAPLPEAVGLVIVLSLTRLGGRRGRRPRKTPPGGRGKIVPWPG